MNGYFCQYCKYYEYDSDLTKVYWKLTQSKEEDIPKIGRCTYGGKTCGNAVLSKGYHSDGYPTESLLSGKVVCHTFEHRGIPDELKFKRYDVFEYTGEKCNTIVWIDRIQYEYAPRLYRIATIEHGEWSASEEDLSDESRYRLIWREGKE